MLLILAVIDLSTTAVILWALVLLAACAGLAAFGDIGRKMVALLSALVFPTLAALNAVRLAPESPTPAAHVLRRSIGRLLVAIATTCAGGVLIVGLLSERQFMLRVDQFAGVKAAHLIPVLALALLYAGGIAWKSEVWGIQRRKLARTLREISANPILWWQIIAVIFAAAVVGLMVLRSGNDSGLEVSSWEIKCRAILDRILYVRPRTKEFLVGYPALVAGIAFALRGRRQWAAPLIVFGSIGLISALNTFCHIHTPLPVSAWRIVNGKSWARF